MTRAMAREWARYGIRVNSLLPGYIETEINVRTPPHHLSFLTATASTCHSQSAFLNSDFGRKFVERLPRRRVGAPSDLDGPLLLLAGDGGAFMTGSSVLVDDGQVFGL